MVEDSFKHLDNLFNINDSFVPNRNELNQIDNEIEKCNELLEQLKTCSNETQVNIDTRLNQMWLKLDRIKTRFYNLNATLYKPDFQSSLKNGNIKVETLNEPSCSPIRKTKDENKVEDRGFKITSSIQHDNGNRKRYNYKANVNRNGDNGMMANIHLDFHNESIDDSTSNFQMTSTPRYNHIEIENTVGHDLHSKPAKQSLLLTSKTYSDKSVATVEDKSSQTDQNKKTTTKFSSIGDSGILSHLENTTNSAIGLYSTPIPLNGHSRIKESKSFASRSMQATPKRYEIFTENSKSMPHVDQILELKSLKKNEIQMDEISNGDEELDEEVSNDRAFKLRKRGLKEYHVKEEVDIEDTIAPVDVNVEEFQEKKFSLIRFLKYCLFLMILFALLILYLLPAMFPSCCDFKRSYVIFNEQKYNDDQPLPF